MDPSAGLAPTREPCGVCGRRGALRQATRDALRLCADCWDAYEASCDEEEAYWQSQAHPEQETATEGNAAAHGAAATLTALGLRWLERERQRHAAH